MTSAHKDVSHHAEPIAVKSSKKRKCMAHCRRFWWAYLIAAICIIVLVVCLVIFVGVPNIAQDKMNEAKLEIQSVRILNTESDSYLMEIDSTITTDGSLHAQVDPFVGRMYLEDLEPHTAFATLNFPETSAEAHQIVNISQPVTIDDMEAFTTFNIWFANNETVRITVEGDTKVKPSGLNRKYDVTFKKTLEVKGLNMFEGTTVSDGTISILPGDDGNNFWAKADIPNASVFTLDVGNVSFANLIGDEEVGTLFIENLLLKPGSNVVDVAADIENIPVLEAVNSDDYCETGIVPFRLRGKTVENHGENISYFAAGLASGYQTVTIDIGTILKKDLNMTVECGSHLGGDGEGDNEGDEDN